MTRYDQETAAWFWHSPLATSLDSVPGLRDRQAFPPESLTGPKISDNCVDIILPQLAATLIRIAWGLPQVELSPARMCRLHEAGSCSAALQSLSIFGTQRFSALFTRACHLLPDILRACNLQVVSVTQRNVFWICLVPQGILCLLQVSAFFTKRCYSAPSWASSVQFTCCYPPTALTFPEWSLPFSIRATSPAHISRVQYSFHGAVHPVMKLNVHVCR
jgi:hypothetical protein